MPSSSEAVQDTAQASATLKRFSLLERLSRDYPNLKFVEGARFSFRPPKTIVIGPDEGEKTPMLLFHELGHALSKKYSYALKIERLKIEVAAWQAGKEAYQKYPELPPWDDEFVEDALDTYRDWLHNKSICKTCGLTMYQTPDKSWLCPFCNQFTGYPQHR